MKQMKRIIRKGSAPLLALLLLTGCSQESSLPTGEVPEEPSTGIPVKIQANINAAMEGETDTRVGGTGTIPSGYQLRCILEIYAGEKSGDVYTWKDVPITREVVISNSYSLPSTAFSNVRLLPKNVYKAVAWADFVPTNTTVDYCYTTTNNLRNLKQTGKKMQYDVEVDDAYSGISLAFGVDRNGSMYDAGSNSPLTTIPLTLIRPMVKVDIPRAWISSEPTGDNLGIIYHFADGAKRHRMYDALTKKATWVEDGVSGVTMPYICGKHFYLTSLNTPFENHIYHQARLYLFASSQEANPSGEDIEIGIGEYKNNNTLPYYHYSLAGAVSPIKLLLTKQNVKITIKGSTDDYGYNRVRMTPLAP